MPQPEAHGATAVRILLNAHPFGVDRPNERCLRVRQESYALSTLVLIHDRLATTMLLFMAAVGVWGLFSYLRGGTLSGSLAGTFVIGQGLVAAQVIAGVVLVLRDARPATSVHYLYGATAVLVFPFAWTYLKDRNPRQALLVYSLLALFIAGLSIRGMTTGG